MKRVVMIGSGREVHGGVSAMVNVCFEHGLFERWEAEYLATHCDGGKARKAWRASRTLAAFGARLASGRVALVHAQIATGASFWRKLAFLSAARAAGTPYVLHLHADLTPYHARVSPRTRAMIRWLYEGAHVTIALSPAARADVLALVPGARVEVVPNPVKIPPWRPPVMPQAPTALYLGVVREAKGVFDLLRAWPRVLAAVPTARLVIAGSGEIDAARALAAELGIARSVEFPGWVGAEEKARRLAEASALVLPSHVEALPMAVLEGMAAGLPIVATRVGAIPEAVGADAGLLVEPRDVPALGQALAVALGEEPRRVAMGAAGRLRAQRAYTPDVVVPAIEAIWESVAPQSKRTTPHAAHCP